MEKRDKNFKVQWLSTWIACMISSCIGLTFWLLNSPLPFKGSFYLVLTVVLILVAVNYVTYRCVYLKPGTKFLNFLLISSAFSILYGIFLYLSKAYTSVNLPYYGMFLFVNQILNILWFITCWNMRKLNKRLQVSN